MNEPQEQSKAAGAASELTVGLGIAKCINCGSDRYQIQHLISTWRQRLFVVECGECKDKIIPVVVDYFMPEAELYGTCAAAWNEANTMIPKLK